MSPKILVSCPSAEVANIAREMAPGGFETVVVHNDAEVVSNLPGIEYMICYPHIPMKDEFYKAVPKLRLVQLLSAGYDNVDLEAARRAKVPLSNNGGANAISVSEHAMMLMLTVARKVVWQHASVSGGRWRGNGPAPRMYELHDKTLGIIGLGTIGKKVARLGAAVRHAGAVFRHRAAVRRPGRPAQCEFPPAARIAAHLRRRVAARAAERVDAPHDRQGRARADETDRDHRQHLARAGDRRGCARRASFGGQDLRAGLDVFDQEPPPSNNPLFRLDNVVLTAHFAGPTWDNHVARFRNAFDNVQRVARGEPPLWVVPELA